MFSFESIDFERQGEELDAVEASFYVNATEFEEIPVNPAFRNGTGPGELRLPKSCEEKCPNILNVLCLLWNRCWKRLAKLIAIISAVAVLSNLGWTPNHKIAPF